MSTNTLAPDEIAPPEELAPLVPGLGRGFASLAAAIAPMVAAAAALLVHFFIPNPRNWIDPFPKGPHPYPSILEAIIAVSLAAAVAQRLWRPLVPWVRHYGPLVAGSAVVMTVWELVTLKTNWMPLPYFPGPDHVFGALVTDRLTLLESTWHSLRLLVSGYLVGVVAGLLSGVLIGWFRQARYWGMPVLKLVGPIPATALVPLVMMIPYDLFYCGVVLIAYAVCFPVTMLTASGIANVRLSYLDVAKTLGAGRFYLIFRVAIPSALPNIFIGLFIGLTVSFLTLIVAETVGVKAGLGAYLLMQKGNAEYANVFASLLIMLVFFSTLMTLLFKFRDFVLKWQKGVIRW